MAIGRCAAVWLLVVLTHTWGVAQTTYHHNTIWGRIAFTDSITTRLRWELFLQHRRQNTTDDELNALRAPLLTSYWFWLHYSLTPTTRLSVSPFGYFKNWTLIAQPPDAARPAIREFRWSARLDQEQRFARLTLLNRYGLEYRWRDLARNSTFVPNWRVRYMLRLEKPIRAAWLKRPLSAVISDELFVQFGRAVRGNPNVFDQNRLYGGFNVGISPSVRGSLGYIYGIQQRSSGREFDYSNIIWTVLTFDNVLSQFKKKPVRL